MAAPLSKTIGDLSGKWIMNKAQSNPVEPALVIQQIGWATRKIVGMATITLDIKQYKAPPSPPADPSGPEVMHIEIEQTGTAGLKGSTERRCLDWVAREHSDWLFGTVHGQTKWIKTEDIEDAFLKGKAGEWLEGDEEKGGPAGETHLWSHVVNEQNEWTADQIWGFQLVEGVRKYVRHIVVANKKGDRAELKLVYDNLE